MAHPHASPLLAEYQARHAVPVLTNGSGVAPQWNSAASPTHTPFSSTALLQDQTSYRSLFTGYEREESAHSLLSEDVARAVHMDETVTAGRYAPEQAWLQQSSLQKASFEPFGATNKYASYQPAPPAAHAKELSMPTVAAASLPVVSPPVPIARSVSLPAMPAFVEASCFSLAKAAIAPSQMWTEVKKQLTEAGVIFAERTDKKYQLDCQASTGCTEFKVCCFGGHYRECGVAKPASAAHAYTVEFQRRAGCSVAFIELFSLMLVMLSRAGGEQPLQLDSRITPKDPPQQKVEGEIGDADADLALLPIPSLRSSSVGATPCIVPSPSLFDSLHDLLSSADPRQQVNGLQALALCLDGSQPEKEAQLMGEVSAMLADGESESVKQVAAMLISKASQMHSSARTLIQTCLPACIESLSGAVVPANVPAGSSLDASLCAARQKCLMRTCQSLAAACPQEFSGVLMGGDDGAVRASRLKRQLLLLSGNGADEEMRTLAMQTLTTIKV